MEGEGLADGSSDSHPLAGLMPRCGAAVCARAAAVLIGEDEAREAVLCRESGCEQRGAGRKQLEEGELVSNEVSCKFRRETIEAELAEVGLGVLSWHTDPRERFAVTVAGPGSADRSPK